MRAFTIAKSDIDRCPFRSLSPSHYRADGKCACRVGSEPPTLEPVEVRETVEGTAYRFANQADRARFLTYNFPRLAPVRGHPFAYRTPDGRRITVYGAEDDLLMVWKGGT